MLLAQTSFAEAEKEFKNFLLQNNSPTKIVWLFREDIVSRNVDTFETDFWVKTPLPKENNCCAEAYYEHGKRKGLGVCFLAFALLEDKVCCCIQLPQDEEDAQFLMYSPIWLKFSVVTELPRAPAIESSIVWHFRKWSFRYRRGCYLVYLPSRKSL